VGGTGVRVSVAAAVAVRVAVRVSVGRVLAVLVALGATVLVEVAVGTRTTSCDDVDTAPGPGLATLTFTVPAALAVPVAVNSVEELKVVGSATPFHKTCAPTTNRLPLTWKVKGPKIKLLGVIAVNHGIWLRTVTAQVS
jgi:hypothetical protein